MANRFDTTQQASNNRFDTASAFDRDTFKRGILYAENRGAVQSGQDPYKVVGVTKDLGKYQVSPSSLRDWSKAWLGRQYTPQEFLNDPQAQEEFFNQYMNVAERLNLTQEQAAAAWHKGWGELGTGEPRPVRDTNFFAALPQKVNEAKDYLTAFGNGLSSNSTASAIQSVSPRTATIPQGSSLNLASAINSGGIKVDTPPQNKEGFITRIGNAVSNELPGLRVLVGKFTGEDTAPYQQQLKQKQQETTHPEPVVIKDENGEYKVNPKGMEQLHTLVMGSIGGEDLANVADDLAKAIAKTSDEGIIREVLQKTQYPAEQLDTVIPSLVKATTSADVKAVLKKGVVIGDARATLANAEARMGVKPVETPSISQELQPLAEEARKYKSAEEFVDNQAYVYHASPAKNLESIKTKGLVAGERPLYFSQGKPSAWAGEGEPVFRTPRAFVENLKENNDALSTLSTESNVPAKHLDVSFDGGKTWEALDGNNFSKSQLTDFYNKVAGSNAVNEFKAKAEEQLQHPIALTAREKRIIENGPRSSTERTLLRQEIERPTTPESPVASQSTESMHPTPLRATVSEGEARSIEKQAREALATAKTEGVRGAYSLPEMVQDVQTPVNKKVNLLDYFRTPEKVLQKIGLGDEAKLLRTQYEKYLKELPVNIEKITNWSKEVPPESNARIFKYLDGQPIDLNEKELKVAGEIKDYLSEWADRLNLPKDKRIANYITHIFDNELIQKEFDEDLAKIIRDKVPGAVYDPFLQQRLGALGYKEDTWAALDAYTKRATRKVNMDPALEKIADKAASFEESQWNYVKRYMDKVNMRPTELDNLIDNTIKSVFGYKYGQRPLVTLSQKARQMVYRGALGLNVGSALRNLTQGVNTYAELGEKYTALGYVNLLRNGTGELKDVGVLADEFIQDRTLSAVKTTLQKVDKGLFSLFETAEKINRGSAYYGAKAKALAEGKTLEEAVDYAKSVVRKTQFSFGKIDTPVVLGSDIAKTLAQFQSFSLKQAEFLTDKVAQREWAGLLRYVAGSALMLGTIGKLFGMKWIDIIPSFRFGAPPTLTIPKDIATDALTQKDQYGQPLTTKKVVKQLGNDLVPFVPVGVQAKKTLQGVSAVSQGKSTTSNGKTQYKIKQTPSNYVRGALFGKTNLPEAQKYYDKKNNPKKKAVGNRF